jgi:drug/metabolite transporter (DMT)-like permease
MRFDRHALGLGLACALLAGALWGLVFIAPLLLHDYPALILSIGRYTAFGLIALPLAWRDRVAIARLTQADWIEAAKLSLIGNLIYYAFLAAAIQAAGAPLPTMIIGTLPVVIALCSNLHSRQIAWLKLTLSLPLITVGILLVNRDELAAVASAQLRQSLLFGAVLATAAVVCWTWYPIRNSIWLQRNALLGSSTWATAQGLTTLPLALGAGIALFVLSHWSPQVLPAPLALLSFDWPLGPRPTLFVTLMLALGLLASWLGTLLWNRASQLLPTALSGQLIVFETLAALLYAFVLREALPQAGTMLGIGLLVLGVIVAVRSFRPRA